MSESKVIDTPLEVYIRKSDLDDVEQINALITEELKHNLNKLYDYPNVLNLLERYLPPHVDLISLSPSSMNNKKLLEQVASTTSLKVSKANSITFTTICGKSGLHKPSISKASWLIAITVFG